MGNLRSAFKEALEMDSSHSLAEGTREYWELGLDTWRTANLQHMSPFTKVGPQGGRTLHLPQSLLITEGVYDSFPVCSSATWVMDSRIPYMFR